ncbi:MAG: glycosyltransferase [Candidatus Thorarchaeota archaeon]
MISPLPPEKPGEAAYTANLIREITKEEKIIVHAIAGRKADHRLDNENIRTHSIWNGNSLSYPFHIFGKICRLNPHLVHVQFGPHGEVYGGMFGEPMLLLLLLLRLAGIRTTMTLHSTWMPQQVRTRIEQKKNFGFFSIFAEPLFRLFMMALRKSTTMLQLSTVRLDSLLRRKFLDSYRFDPNRVKEIPHPCGPAEVSLNREKSSRKLNLLNRRVILLFGFIRRGKGIELAIDAMRILQNEMKDVLLLIAGMPQDDDGQMYLTELKNRVSTYNLEEVVRFDTKYISQEEIGNYISASTTILVPYSESVGASGPIHNFAVYGIPIVASDTGYHMRETLGGNILIFKSQDVEDLADVLSGLLSDEEKQREVSMKQREYASIETWEVAGKRTIQTYLETMKE